MIRSILPTLRPPDDDEDDDEPPATAHAYFEVNIPLLKKYKGTSTVTFPQQEQSRYLKLGY